MTEFSAGGNGSAAEMINMLNAFSYNNIMARLNEITFEAEGLENPANAAEMNSLRTQQQQLLAQKNSMKAQIKAIDETLHAIEQKINTLGSGTRKILAAIKSQRWYYFKNKPRILMDKNTGLLWQNPAYFPYFKSEINSQRVPYSLEEAKDIVKNLNLDGYADWHIVTMSEFEYVAREGGLPFWTGDRRQIAGWDTTIINNYGKITSVWTDCNYPKENGGGTLIVCNSQLTNDEYAANVSQNNQIYTEDERAQMTLNLFVQNGLVPIFRNKDGRMNEEANRIYQQIYIERPRLLQQLQQLELNQQRAQAMGLTANFDYRSLLSGYDISAINSSVIQYYQAVFSITEKMLGILQKYENEQHATMEAFAQIGLQLSSRYTDHPHLTEQENQLLADQQQVLASRLELGMDTAKSQILAVRQQAQTLEQRLNEISFGSDAMHELAELEQEQRASFVFLVENMARIMKEVQQKIAFFTQHRSFVTNIIDIYNARMNDYKLFKTSMHDDFASLCQQDGIEADVYGQWYAKWQENYFASSQRFLPLVEFALQGHLLENTSETHTAAEQILFLLGDYESDINDFYLNERKGIYQQYIFQAGGDLQDKIAAELALYQISEKFQKQMMQMIFSRQNAEERMFLLKWAEPFFTIQIDNIQDFLQEGELADVSRETLERLTALKRQNLTAYLADSQAYSQALQQRDKDFNALLFRMRTDLQNKVKDGSKRRDS
ncbi:MAG: hypothetical protein ACI4OH_04685 [Mitsuokella sp.]|uniref:hypothetical protein n=1 Tax=Mitsuokella sp. TaxID=2049034 RepID=UPI003F11164B